MGRANDIWERKSGPGTCPGHEQEALTPGEWLDFAPLGHIFVGGELLPTSV